MKKIIKSLLAFTLMLSMLTLPSTDVHAVNNLPVESIKIVGLDDGVISEDETISLSVTSSMDVMYAIVVYKTADGFSMINYSGDDREFSNFNGVYTSHYYEIHSELKNSVVSGDIVAIKIACNNDGDEYGMWFSDLSASELEEFEIYETANSLSSYLVDTMTSFTVDGAVIDRDAPLVTSIDLSQDGSKINVKMNFDEINEISEVVLRFKSETTDDMYELVIPGYLFRNNNCDYTFEVITGYTGMFKLVEVTTRDSADNWGSFDYSNESITIDLSKSKQLVSSYEIVGLEDGKIQANDKLTLNVESDMDINSARIFYKYVSNGETYYDNLKFKFNSNNDTQSGTYTVDPSLKYKFDTAEIVYILLGGEYNYDNYEVAYTNYSRDDLVGITGEGEFTNIIYSLEKYTSIQNTDVNLDSTAPTLKNYSVVQDGYKVNITVDAEDDASGVSEIVLNFNCLFYNSFWDVYESFDISFSLNSKNLVDGVYKLDTTLLEHYGYLSDNEVRNYELNRIEVRDNVGNTTTNEYTSGPTIVLKKEDNPIKNIEDAEYTVRGNVFDKIYLRKDTGYGDYGYTVEFRFDDGFTYEVGGDLWLEEDSNYLKKTGSYEVEQSVSVLDQEIIVNVPFEVVEPVGEILYYESGFEYCVNYKDAKELGVPALHEAPYTNCYVKMYDTGEVKVDTMKTYGLGMAFDGKTTHTGATYIYHPKYYSKVEENKVPDVMGFVDKRLKLDATFIFHLVDDDGNLVTYNGTVVVPYEERENIELQTYNEHVNVSTLYGTLPSYAFVNAVENNSLDDIFSGNYVAYDITLETLTDGAIQPVGTVDVNVKLPENLQGKEVEVYYVDDNGNKTEHESVVSSDGTSVTFTTDHFSTYVIAAKESEVKNGICADENGKLWYYVDNVKTYGGLMYVDGYYYYARTSGEIVANRSYWITKTNNLLPEANYTFDAEGKMVNAPVEEPEVPAVLNGIHADTTGKLWYYENNVKTYGGLMYVDGYYYYARTSGEIVVNRSYWITKTNNLLPEANYTFDAEGKMVNAPVEEPEVPASLNGIHADENGKLWYYENDVKTYGGLMYIDGYYYYARTSGEIVVNRSYWITKTNDLLPQSTYTFDENGKIDF